MKVLLVNGSPRKNFNTMALLKKAEEGAKAAGADETEIVNLYDHAIKGCVECYACKLKNRKQDGLCALKDDLTPVLQKTLEADVMILGAPVFFNLPSAQARAYLERAMFPMDQYHIENGHRTKPIDKYMPTGLVYTMNCPEDFMDQVNYRILLGDTGESMRHIWGYNKILYVNDTYQFSNYDLYLADMFPEDKKRAHRDEQWIKDLQAAYDLGKHLVELKQAAIVE